MFKVGYEYKYYLSDNVYICLAVSSEGDAILKAKEGDKKFLLYAHVYDKYIEILSIITKYAIMIHAGTDIECLYNNFVFETKQEAIEYIKELKSVSTTNIVKLTYIPNDPFAEKC